jgi:hypothetical protein
MLFQLKECIQPGIHSFSIYSQNDFIVWVMLTSAPGALVKEAKNGNVNYYKVCESIVRMKVDG